MKLFWSLCEGTRYLIMYVGGRLPSSSSSVQGGGGRSFSWSSALIWPVSVWATNRDRHFHRSTIPVKATGTLVKPEPSYILEENIHRQRRRINFAFGPRVVPTPDPATPTTKVTPIVTHPPPKARSTATLPAAAAKAACSRLARRARFARSPQATRTHTST